MENPNFPEWYHEQGNSYMFLHEISPTVYNIMPPSQRDWFYTLTKLEEKKWLLEGVKDDPFEEKIKYVYIYTKTGKWTCYQDETPNRKRLKQ